MLHRLFSARPRILVKPPKPNDDIDKKQQEINRLGLRSTYCNNVYCTKNQPHIHYVWNPATEQMEELKGIEYINKNGKTVNGAYINNGTLQAYLQGYKFTEENGVYEKNGKKYTYNAETQKFEEFVEEVPEDDTNAPARAEERGAEDVDNVPPTTDTPEIKKVKDFLASHSGTEPLSKDDVNELLQMLKVADIAVDIKVPLPELSVISFALDNKAYTFIANFDVTKDTPEAPAEPETSEVPEDVTDDTIEPSTDTLPKSLNLLESIVNRFSADNYQEPIITIQQLKMTKMEITFAEEDGKYKVTVKCTDPEITKTVEIDKTQDSTIFFIQQGFLPNPATAAIEALDKADGSVRTSIGSVIGMIESDSLSRRNSRTMDTRFSYNADGTINLKDSGTSKIYETLFNEIKLVVGTDGFDENTLKALYQSAWIMTYSSFDSTTNDISDFLDKVYENFKKILNSVDLNAQTLTIFTSHPVTDNQIDPNGGTTINCSRYSVYDDGSVHVSDNEQDAELQNAFKELREQLRTQYPQLRKSTFDVIFNSAAENAIKSINSKNVPVISGLGIGNNQKARLNAVMDLTLFYFEKALFERTANSGNIFDSMDSQFQKTTAKAYTRSGSGMTIDQEKAEVIEDSADPVINTLNDIFDSNYIAGLLSRNGCTGSRGTDMTIADNGDLKFHHNEIQKSYEELFEAMWSKSGINTSGLTKEEFRAIYNTAWISIYSEIDNLRCYDMQNIFEKVVQHLENIMNKLKENPYYITIILQKSSVTQVESDKTVINYSNTDVNLDYGDGNVHLGDDNSDKQYQKAVKELKSRLKGRYVPPLSEDQFNEWFTQAQKDAITACDKNSHDILFGMQCNDWSRKGDGYKIRIGQLMQLIAYKFDKIMYQNLFNE